MTGPSATDGPMENIGPRERRKRRLTAAVALVVALAALAGLVAAEVPRAWRLALFLPFWFAALGWFQAQAGT